MGVERERKERMWMHLTLELSNLSPSFCPSHPPTLSTRLWVQSLLSCLYVDDTTLITHLHWNSFSAACSHMNKLLPHGIPVLHTIIGDDSPPVILVFAKKGFPLSRRLTSAQAEGGLSFANPRSLVIHWETGDEVLDAVRKHFGESGD